MTSSPAAADLEKAAGLSFSPSHHHPNRDHPHYSQARERLRQFLHPEGKRIHVANSPEEAQRLRRQLSQRANDEQFDVCISGTPEHIEYIRSAQAHHEDRREQLRSQHQEVYERFADVYTELDALSHELDRVTTHGVSLQAHFSKFGYDAHIRSYDDHGESPNASGATTPRSKANSLKESSVEKGYATPLKLFKVPVLRQYFHKGILWRGSGSEEVQSFELFVDLLYVGILAINGDAASETPTGKSLLSFIITFTLSMKIWNDMAFIISWFETDDIFQRVSILFLLACLFGYTTNITHAFVEDASTYATLIGFYLAARLYMASYLVLVAILVPMVRSTMLWNVIVVLVGAALWIGSIHVDYPNQLALIWTAMFVDICGQIAYVFVIIAAEKVGPKAKAWMDRAFEFYPAVNIEHRTERMNAFVTLVFGYTVVAILYQSTVNGVDAHYGKAVLGLTQAFCFNWLYFEVDGSNLQVHAIRRHKMSAFAWSMTHLPFIMAFILAGGALARLVLAVDTPDSHLEALAEAYRDRSEEVISNGIRWFYCAGLGVSLACMGLISISHVHKEMEGLRLRKCFRLVGRFAVAIILICLPTATSLDSLELIGTVTALIVFTLATELWAASSCNEKLLQRTKPCQYFGQCGKKDLERYLKSGQQVDIETLGRREKDGGLAWGPA